MMKLGGRAARGRYRLSMLDPEAFMALFAGDAISTIRRPRAR